MLTSNEVRLRLGTLVNRYADEVGRLVGEHPAGWRDDSLSELTHHLGLLLAGANPSTLGTVRAGIVGFGSRVVLEDLASGAVTTHHVMASSAMDFDADHVSIESPVGAAIVGEGPGAVVQVRTPQGYRSLRIVALQTLLDLLDRLNLQGDGLLAGAAK